MRIGFVIQNQAPNSLEQVQTLAPELERIGYDSVWLTDHVVGVRSFAERGYTDYWLECLASLGFIAAQTSRIRIGTSILVVPVRNPVYTAKVLSTLDNLSGGRLNIGVGTGWSKAEFHALGAGEFHEPRGDMTNAMLSLMIRCWQGGEFDWESEHFNFRRITFEPVPVQRPHPPLLIGGPAVPAVARRLDRYGDAWHPAGTDAGALREGKAKLEDLVGRPVRIVFRWITAPDTGDAQIADQLGLLRELGCEEAIIDFRPTDRAAALDAAQRAIEVFRSLQSGEAGA